MNHLVRLCVFVPWWQVPDGSHLVRLCVFVPWWQVPAPYSSALSRSFFRGLAAQLTLQEIKRVLVKILRTNAVLLISKDLNLELFLE